MAWPLRGRLSSNYGYRSNPFTNVRQFHNGIDIVASLNSAAHAAMDGRVAEIGYSTIFGNFIILTHSGGYQTLYAHMNKISVRKGQNISQGMTIGLTGSTGYSTGPHLHFGLFKNGVAIDPLKMLGS
ncbi:MAG: M23 family metallopeptidase [Spirochaetales bacterium]|nr:MAG: M23 family metallopeptidase [Spirochaetales bacterium]